MRKHAGLCYRMDNRMLTHGGSVGLQKFQLTNSHSSGKVISANENFSGTYVSVPRAGGPCED
jgi:hypothetical protein